MDEQVTTKADLDATLADLGIEAGDRIVVHSSLSSLGHFVGGPRAVCEGLMERVTAAGVVMMPSFNHGAIFSEGEAGVFDPLESRTTNGIVPDTFWRMEGVYRSLNPTHAVAVWGNDARSFVEGHHATLTMGPGSPLHRLEQRGGKAVFVDCLHANTHHHVVEVTNGVACLGRRTEEYPVELPSGERVRCRTWGWRESSCQVTDEGAYQEVLTDRGLLEQATLADATISVLALSDSRAVVEECLAGDVPDIEGCQPCEISPRTTDATVASDWDEERQRVDPSTSAFVGDWDCGATAAPGPSRA
jgi:aminoglycoside 3-N-acetyltransferase